MKTGFFSKGDFLFVFLCLLFAGCFYCLGKPIRVRAISEGDLYSISAVLLDAESKRVLWGKDEHRFMANASTTKILTCILVLEEGDLEERTGVSSYAASQPKVKLYAKRGETYCVKDLLHSLMLESHNDTAVILAEYIGKKYLDEELRQKEAKDFTMDESRLAVNKFMELMNKKASAIGCDDTFFITPNGLDATCVVGNGEGSVTKEHGTTAYDLSKIMAYCVLESPKKDEFIKIANTDSYEFYANNRQFHCVNHNAFLHMMDGVMAGKTGFTNKAGYCYVAALQSEGRHFVVALLGCGWPNNRGYKWKDAKELFTYACKNYFRGKIRDEALMDQDLGKLNRIPVEDGYTENLDEAAFTSVVVKKGKGEDTFLLKKEDAIRGDLSIEPCLNAPVYKGQKVGRVQYFVNDSLVLEDEIITCTGVEKRNYIRYLELVFARFLFC